MRALFLARDVSRETYYRHGGLHGWVHARYFAVAPPPAYVVVTVQVPDAEMVSTFVPAQAAFEVRAGLSQYAVVPSLLRASCTAVPGPGWISLRKPLRVVAT